MKNPMFQKTKNLLIDYTLYETPYKMTRRHYHDNYEIYLVTEGERLVYFDDKQFTIKKGDLFIAEPFLPHGTESTDNPKTERYIIGTEPDDLRPLLSDEDIKKIFKPLTTCVVNLRSYSFDTIRFYYSEMLRYSQKFDPLSRKLKMMACIEALHTIGNELKENTVHKIESNLKTDIPIIGALSYINQHFTEEISLDFISSYVHMSKSNFCLVFKKTMGETFVDYMNTLRISHVHKLLVETNKSLTDIAAQSGYSSVDYMTRTFKKVHGMTPSQVRRYGQIDHSSV